MHTKLTATVRRPAEAAPAMEMMAVAAASPPFTTWIPPPQLDEAAEGKGGVNRISSDSRWSPLLLLPKHSCDGNIHRDDSCSDVPKCHPFDGESIPRDDSCMDIQKRMMIFPTWHQPMIPECSIPFPIRLYRLLQIDEVSSIVSWDPHGCSFHIRDVKKFIFDVLPRYFHQTKLSLFRRQLHVHGFRQIGLSSSPNTSVSRNHNRGSYYHDFFVRDRPDLCFFVAVHRGKMPSQPPCGHTSSRSLLPSSPLPLSSPSPSSVVDSAPVGRRSHSSTRTTKLARSSPGRDASHNIPTFDGIPSHPLPPPLSSSSSSQRSTTTNHTLTSIITSHPTGKYHDKTDGGEKDGIVMTRSQTCHGVRRNHHDSGTIPFRPLSMKPRLPTVIMTKKSFMSNSSSSCR